MAYNVAEVNRSRRPSSTEVYGYGQAKRRNATATFWRHSTLHAEDDGDGAGNEEGHRQEVDPPHPEHGRQLARKEAGWHSRAPTMRGTPTM